MEVKLPEDWYERRITLEGDCEFGAGAFTWGATNNGTTADATLESVHATMRKIEAMIPPPPVQRVIMLKHHWEAVKNAKPAEATSPPLPMGLPTIYGIPVDVCQDIEEACRLAKELAKAGIRVVMCVDDISNLNKPATACRRVEPPLFYFDPF